MWEQPYEKYLSVKSAGGTYDDIDDDRVEVGYMLIVDHVSVENRNSAFSSIRIGVNTLDFFHVFEEEKNPVANEVYWTRSPIIVREGQNLRVRCTGCSSGDYLHVFIQGILRKVKETEEVDHGGDRKDEAAATAYLRRWEDYMGRRFSD